MDDLREEIRKRAKKVYSDLAAANGGTFTRETDVSDRWVPQRGPHFDLVVLSRQLASLGSPERPHVVISISEPGRKSRPEFDPADPFRYSRPHLPPCAGRLGVLELDFYDLEDGLGAERGGYDLFEAEMAQRAFDFVRLHRPGLVLVHCEAGASRSPALAAVLMEWQGGDPSHFLDPRHFSPNGLVLARGRAQIEADGGWA